MGTPNGPMDQWYVNFSDQKQSNPGVVDHFGSFTYVDKIEPEIESTDINKYKECWDKAIWNLSLGLSCQHYLDLTSDDQSVVPLYLYAHAYVHMSNGSRVQTTNR